ALAPGVELTPASSDDLNRALQLVIRQRLIALEAERLPSAEPTEDDIKSEINRILAGFSTSREFVERLKSVGFSSVDDENFQRLISQRISIERYLDFRFRSFVVITPDAEKVYYDDVFVPDFKRRNPGIVVPDIEDVRVRINQILVEERVASDIESFLDNARNRAEIVILSEV
ncbi:MAG: integrating conjugative element protein, partial [Acidobacteriota bacterium]|nr:integrating conjugative element protein [Acidobacteriota bacterium]